MYVYEDLLAFEIISESWTNPIGDIQSSFPVVGWNLSSHVPVQLKRIHILHNSNKTFSLTIFFFEMLLLLRL